MCMCCAQTFKDAFAACIAYAKKQRREKREKREKETKAKKPSKEDHNRDYSMPF